MFPVLVPRAGSVHDAPTFLDLGTKIDELSGSAIAIVE
jgi:hypothetical protein